MNDIKHIDALEGLQELKDNSIDVIITDPPYWLGSKLKIDDNGQYVGQITDCKHLGTTWEIGDGYWLESVFKEFSRVLKYGGMALVFTIDRLADLPTYNARRAGFDVCQSIYWKFNQGIPKGAPARKRVEALLIQGSASTRALREQEYNNPTGDVSIEKYGSNGFMNNMELRAKKINTIPLTDIGRKVEGTTYGTACLAPAVEIIGVYRKPYKYDNMATDIIKSMDDPEVRPPVVNTGAYREKYGKFPSQILEISKPTRAEKKAYPHSTLKPISLLNRLVELFTSENDLILDPFCGSGTTLKACQNHNRNYIGFDNDVVSINMAKERINADNPE